MFGRQTSAQHIVEPDRGIKLAGQALAPHHHRRIGAGNAVDDRMLVALADHQHAVEAVRLDQGVQPALPGR